MGDKEVTQLGVIIVNIQVAARHTGLTQVLRQAVRVENQEPEGSNMLAKEVMEQKKGLALNGVVDGEIITADAR